MNEDIKMKNQNVKKIFLKTFIAVFSIAILIIMLVTIISTINSSNNLAFGNYKFYIMKADSLSNVASKGDLVVVKKHKPDEIQVRDNIVYKSSNNYYAETVIETKKADIVNKIIILEDNGIKYQFDETEIEGKVLLNIPKIGNLIIFLKSPIGIIVFLLFITCLTIILRTIFIGRKCKDNNTNIKK